MEPLERILQIDTLATPDYSLEATLLSLLLAFLIGQANAWVYAWTHTGLSYSRTFTQSLVLLTVVVALVMFVIGNSIITAFGLIGALAIIRFRNVLKDTRDTSFVFFSLVLGMAVGSQRYLTAILGASTLFLVVFYLRITAFGSRGHFDGHLSFRLSTAAGTGSLTKQVLTRFCRKRREISVHHISNTDQVEYVYQVRLRDRRRGGELLEMLQGTAGIGEASLVLRDELSEV